MNVACTKCGTTWRYPYNNRCGERGLCTWGSQEHEEGFLRHGEPVDSRGRPYGGNGPPCACGCGRAAPRGRKYFKGHKMGRTCAVCDTPLTYQKKYCSKACFGRSMEKYRRKCAHCEEWFAPASSLIKHCSRECRIAAGADAKQGRVYSAERKGENNPNYRNGKSTNRHARGFTLAKKGWEPCRNCGSIRHLHLHHVIPRSKYRDGIDELRNGLPLCATCHRRWHVGHPIYRDVFTKEEWDYLTSVQLTGENIAPWLDKRYPPRPEEEAA